MLLCLNNGFGGAFEDAEDFASDVAFEASHDLIFGFSFGETPCHVVAGGLVATHVHDQDDVQGSVGVAVTAAVESVPDGFAARGFQRQTPQSLARAPSLLIRSGLSPKAASRVAAVSGPTPYTARSCGVAVAVMVSMWCSSIPVPRPSTGPCSRSSAAVGLSPVGPPQGLRLRSI